MEDSQPIADSLGSFKSESFKPELTGDESSFNPHQMILAECEREIQTLERDIRHQKESSINAKTAITFEQLKRIHNLGKILGPQKETFFDRICRAADIQRASLKNRLKQNKEKFEPSAAGVVRSPSIMDSPSVDSQSIIPATLQSFMMIPANNELLRTPSDVPSPSPIHEEEMRLPVERVSDLLQLGFPYEEVKQITELFDQYKELMRPHTPSLTQVLSQFSNFISTSVPEQLKLISSAFNLLEMGYSRREVARTLIRERRTELDECERPSKIPRLSPIEGPQQRETDASDGENNDSTC